MAVIGIDFDGTVVTHEYPKMGRSVGAVSTLLELVNKGHQLVLFTMRSGKELANAVEWFKSNGVPLYGINTNPTQHEWTSSPKAYCHLYIDDASLGIPLIYNGKEFRPYVDWIKVRKLLVHEGYLDD